MATTGEPRRLALEVRFDAQPIEGRVYDDHDGGAGLDRAFSGWLGLMAAIEAARAGDPTTEREIQ
jgi:hypothetical protein